MEYPRKRLQNVPYTTQLLEKIRKDTALVIPFDGFIRPAHRKEGKPKWFLYTVDGQLTKPRIGSLQRVTELLKYKRLIATQVNDNYIEIEGRGKNQRSPVYKTSLHYKGSITRRQGGVHEVNCTRDNGIIAEVRGPKLGVRVQMMYDGEGDILIVEWLRGGRVKDSEIYREEDVNG